MYFLIEDSPQGLSVIGQFYTEEEARKKMIENENNFCNYYITKTV